MAYRPPVVNGELVEVTIRTSTSLTVLAGSKDFFRHFAADLARLVGTPAAPAKAKLGRPAALKSTVARVRVTAARLAAIEIAFAQVAAGRLSHKAAAASLSLTRSGFTSWYHRLEEAARLGRPILAIG